MEVEGWRREGDRGMDDREMEEIREEIREEMEEIGEEKWFLV